MVKSRQMVAREAIEAVKRARPTIDILRESIRREGRTMKLLREAIDPPLVRQIREMTEQQRLLRGAFDHLFDDANRWNELANSARLATKAMSKANLALQDTVAQLREQLILVDPPFGETAAMAIAVNAVAPNLGNLDRFLPPAIQISVSLASVVSLVQPNLVESFARVFAAEAAARSAFHQIPTFDAALNRTIEEFFGDWSRLREIPKAYHENVSVRRDMLDEIGADRAFLDLTPEDGAAIARGPIVDEEADDEVTVLGISTGLILVAPPRKAAADILQHFELCLRARIARVMERAFGPNWVKDCLPDLARDWLERRKIATASGMPPSELIDYSYLVELVTIIETYWEKGFAAEGWKPSVIRKYVMQINPIRNGVAHYQRVEAEQLIQIVHLAIRLEPWLSYSDD